VNGVGASIETLASPASLLAITTLLVNDHLLKHFAPSVVTGKLSDVAGLYFAPLVMLVGLFAVSFGKLERRPMAVAGIVYLGVAGIFAALKLAEATASPLLRLASGFGFPVAITVDPTDLIALGVLPLSYAAWSARLRAAAGVRIGWPRRFLTLSLAAGSIVATSGPPQPSITSLAADPRGDAVYAMVEYTSAADGIYASESGGGSWRQRSSRRGELTVDPRGGGSVYVLHDDSWAPTLERVTADGTSAQVGPPDPGPRPRVVNVYAPTVFAVAPWDPEVLFFGRNGRLLRTLNGGASWNDIGAPGEVQDIAGSSEKGLLYVLTDRSLYRSRDGGERWTFMATVATSSYATPGGLAVHPRDPGLVLVGSRKELLRTTDGGTVLRTVYTDTGPGSPDSAAWSVTFDPSDDDHVYVVSGRGCCPLLESHDRGLTWSDAGVNAVGVTVDSRGNAYVIGGGRDRVLRRVAGRAEWVDITGSLPVTRSR
jgi:hypothetical protein